MPSDLGPLILNGGDVENSGGLSNSVGLNGAAGGIRSIAICDAAAGRTAFIRIARDSVYKRQRK